MAEDEKSYHQVRVPRNSATVMYHYYYSTKLGLPCLLDQKPLTPAVTFALISSWLRADRITGLAWPDTSPRHRVHGQPPWALSPIVCHCGHSWFLWSFLRMLMDSSTVSSDFWSTFMPIPNSITKYQLPYQHLAVARCIKDLGCKSMPKQLCLRGTAFSTISRPMVGKWLIWLGHFAAVSIIA